ncbi:DUF5819 family protein [Kitasatospora sp. NBC_00315]|uniref:DUF5819 family protein n=1 Tax=Kitasatospora sp. NBC_00315 TaxID=2975963 RepID=UPI0032454326
MAASDHGSGAGHRVVPRATPASRNSPAAPDGPAPRAVAAGPGPEAAAGEPSPEGAAGTGGAGEEGATGGPATATILPEGAPAGQGAEPAAPPPWSPGARLVLGAALVVVVGAVLYHLGAVFLFLAPPNELSLKYQQEINAHIYPEFDQNWQLFAPNPLQADIHVQVRVQTLDSGGARAEPDWADLTASDLAAVKHNPAPSHLDQNMLRRGWDYYTTWHSQQDETPTGSGAPLSEQYLKRLALQRVGARWQGSPIVGVQLRSATWQVPGPPWTGPAPVGAPEYRTLGWWAVSPQDYAGLGAA